jgi:hypothetical protein
MDPRRRDTSRLAADRCSSLSADNEFGFDVREPNLTGSQTQEDPVAEARGRPLKWLGGAAVLVRAQ